MLDPATSVVVPRASALQLRVGVLALGGLGGSGRVATDLARGLADAGHEVVLLTCPEPQFGDERGDRLHHVSVRAPRSPRPANGWVTRLADDLVDAIRRHELRVLTVHYGVGLAEAAVQARDRLAAQGYGVRVAVTLHGSDITHLSSCSKEGGRLSEAVHRADTVTAVSETLATQAQRSLRLPSPPRVIVNGVDLDVFRPGPDRLASGRLCHVSNFRPVKRPLDNVEVVEHLVRRGTDVTLTMIGDGPLRPDTEARVRALGLEHAVQFVDPLPQPEVAGHLRSADLALITSQRESFGLVALESLACGTPFVGTRCGGLEELLGSAANLELASHLLVEPGDTLRLAERVARLLRDDDERRDVRRQGLELGRSRFGRPAQLAAYETMLGRLQTEVAA